MSCSKTIRYHAIEGVDINGCSGRHALLAFVTVAPNAKKLGVMLTTKQLRAIGKAFAEIADAMDGEVKP